MMRKFAVLSLAAMCGFGLIGGCQPKEAAPEKIDEPAKTSETPKTDPPKVEEATKPADPTDPLASMTPKDKADRAKIKIEVLKEGKGTPAANGDVCYMEYTGTRVDGFQFDSNANPKKPPFGVNLGAGGVIRGWDLGIVGMKPGQETRLTIPAELAYGDGGQGADIPGGATLIFKVKLFDVLKPEDTTTYDYVSSTPGTGKKAATGDKVKFHLEVKMLNDIQVFTTAADNKPIEVTLGDTSTGYSPGLMAALDGAQAGGKYEVRMPPIVAAGSESASAKDQLLKYSIRVVSVGK